MQLRPLSRGIHKLPVMFIDSRERSPAFLLEASVERQVAWSGVSSLSLCLDQAAGASDLHWPCLQWSRSKHS